MKIFLILFILVTVAVSGISRKEITDMGRVVDGKLVALKTKEKYVVITIDDGPSRYTKRIVEILDNNNVKGEFFVVGSEIRRYPKGLKDISRAGHSINLHSDTHKKLIGMSGKEAYENELSKLVEELDEVVIGNFFRPPYGEMSREQVDYFIENGYIPINWTFDTKDWMIKSKRVDIKSILADIKSKIKPGDIILLHSNKELIRLLPELIYVIKEQGYSFVTLEEYFKGKVELEEGVEEGTFVRGRYRFD